MLTGPATEDEVIDGVQRRGGSRGAEGERGVGKQEAKGGAQQDGVGPVPTTGGGVGNDADANRSGGET